MATKDVTEGFKAYEDGKHRRYSLLFAINGGAFAVAKFLTGGDTTHVAGSLTVSNLAIGMICLNLVLTADIYAFGRKMRRDYVEDAFGWPGKCVLLLLGLLLCGGWSLVA